MGFSPNSILKVLDLLRTSCYKTTAVHVHQERQQCLGLKLSGKFAEVCKSTEGFLDSDILPRDRSLIINQKGVRHELRTDRSRQTSNTQNGGTGRRKALMLLVLKSTCKRSSQKAVQRLPFSDCSDLMKPQIPSRDVWVASGRNTSWAVRGCRPHFRQHEQVQADPSILGPLGLIQTCLLRLPARE